MKIKICLIDMDGTTLDSERHYLQACYDSAQELGYNFSIEFISKYQGYGSDEHREIFLNAINDHDFPYDKWIEGMENRYEQCVQKQLVKLVDGTSEFLDFLTKENILKVICTGTRRSRATQQLKELGIYDKLDYVICGDDVKQSKPAPYCHIEALKRFNLKPEDALVIEDAKCGLEAGKSAGCKVVLIPGVIYIPEEILKQADYVVKDLYELQDLIKKINA